MLVTTEKARFLDPMRVPVGIQCLSSGIDIPQSGDFTAQNLFARTLAKGYP